MQGADVVMLVQRIRELRPDVALVGHSSMERAEHFAALGVNRFLLKPWTAEQLMEVLGNDVARLSRRTGGDGACGDHTDGNEIGSNPVR